MRIKATPVSAVLFGIWTSFVLGSTEILLNEYEISGDTRNIIFLIVGVCFFIIPLPFFVFGVENISFKPWHGFSKEHWEAMPGMAFRGICWFVGAATFGFIYGFVHNQITMQ